MSKPKIISLEAEAVKKIKAVSLQFTQNGLSIVGGKNRNGKTSVLDAIAYALGGEKKRPSDLKNNDSESDPFIRLELSNGLVVERKGKNSSLKVIDPEGKKKGQSLLNSFVSEFSLNIEKFLNAEPTKKRDLLLSALGDSERLKELEVNEKLLSGKRTDVGRERDRAEGAFEKAPHFPDALKVVQGVEEIQKELNDSRKVNEENRKTRLYLDNLKEESKAVKIEIDSAQKRIEEAEENLRRCREAKKLLESRLELEFELIEEIQFEVDCLIEVDLAPIQRKFDLYSEEKAKIEANQKKEELREAFRDKEKEYKHLTTEIESIRLQKKKIVETSKAKLPSLEWDGDELLYKGRKWDGMSGAEQMIVSTSIARVLTPNAGFVLIDKLEQMDLETLEEFGKWLEENDLQAIGTRVSTGEECSFILENGEIK